MTRFNAAPVRCVDVIIACWNRSDTIERAILSALAAPEVAQVIVVDDGSTDDSAAIAEALCARHSRLTVLRMNGNNGPSTARNRALDVANAMWVTILDGDDFILPDRIRQLLTWADEADFIADDLLQVPDSMPLAEIGRPLLGVTPDWNPWVDLESFVLGNVNRRGRQRREMGFLKPLMRRSFIDTHRLRYDGELRLGEDFILYAQALAAGARFRLMPVAGYVAVMRSGSLSGQHGLSDLQALLAANRQLSSDIRLTSRQRRALRVHAVNLQQKIAWLEMICAVKAYNLRRIAALLMSPPTVLLFVICNLIEQLWLRKIASAVPFKGVAARIF